MPRGVYERKNRKQKAGAHVGGGEVPATFIAAVDAEKRLILFDGSAPKVFNEDQTTAIATLLFQHYS